MTRTQEITNILLRLIEDYTGMPRSKSEKMEIIDNVRIQLDGVYGKWGG